MSNMFHQITNYMADNQIIPAEDKAIYQYGLQQGFVLLLNIATILLLGVCNHMVLESVLFLLSYMPLRTFAGGFHARTQLRCYLGGIVLTQIVLSSIYWIPKQLPVLVILAVSAFTIIFALAPVADRNKPLTAKEQQIFRKKAHTLLSFLLAAAALLYLLQFTTQAATVIVSLAALAVMLLLGYPNRPNEQES